ncbi:MAG: hypothetical protein J0I47_04585 [Sphingomonas sp.]|uniref:hypothetical protein n=1 Tax=Sphingomonas sp. TaxID=28214 RepID=UPI001ACE7380|nr:hypothetical protein [Sphingomonas sp.]MBN8807502.1 hypothetical protein [Sphingomonas sp.]
MIDTHRIAWVYGAFALLALAGFVLRPGRATAAWCYFGGWLLLPVGAYPPYTHGPATPIEIMGLVLPANMLVSKAAVVAMVTCIVSLVRDHRRWLALRWRPLDAAILAWCAWPLLRAIVAGDIAGGATQSAYLLAAWGGSWLLGKLYFAGEDGAVALLEGMAWSGMALLLVAMVELVHGPLVYEMFYGRHPYQKDGVERYLGHRPLAMFEDGNQYGIWIAMAALAAIVLVRRDIKWRPGAIVLAIAAVASQSVGAIALLAVGVLAWSGRVRVPARWWKLAGGGLIALAALYVSGIVPFERIARHTAVGEHILAIVRSTGRGSFLWRISQDQKVMPLIHQHLLLGWGRWDWWMPVGYRPWGVPMLTVGQYGLAGLALMMAAMLVAPVLALVRGSLKINVGIVALIVLLAAIDAALNSFIFWPAIVAVGGLADRLSLTAPKRGADRRNAVDNAAPVLPLGPATP